MQTRDSINERLLSVLPSAKNRLEYLTPNDWALVADRSKIVAFHKDEFLIQSGKQTRTVYVILTGTARVESADKVAIATLDPGEVCGEMAFLENAVAAASVKAMKDVEACAIEWSGLNDLFELFPHLGSRFYRSLAVNLSRRLREQIASKKPFVK
jgi:CRP-like cAMP-binding protein